MGLPITMSARILAALWLSGCAGTIAAGSGPVHDPAPQRCKSARPYRGAALHRAPAVEVFSGVTGSLAGNLDAEAIGRLDRAMRAALDKTGATAMSAAVGVPGSGLWSATRTRDGAASGLEFWWASVGKAFTAVAVLQAVESGELKLGDPLARWFPEFPNAKAITIDHLLTHTSGIYSFQSDPELRATPGWKSPELLIDVARRHGNAFCPGEHWSYSNTGYVLLARILERVAGRPFHEILTQRIVDALGLEHTRALVPRADRTGIAEAHPSKPEEAEAGFDFSTPYGAGIVVSRADDMVRFWQALLAGRLLQPETVRAQFERLWPMFGNGTFYGRGVMLYEVPQAEGAPTIWLGHGGGAPGIKAVVAWAPGARAFVAVVLDADGSAEATAHLLLEALRGGG